MPVLGILSYALEVPDLAPGVNFYRDAGLVVSTDGRHARGRCPGQERDSVTLIGGATAKRLHHICLRALQH